MAGISAKMTQYLMRILKTKGRKAYDEAAKNMRLISQGAEEGLEGMAPSNLPNETMASLYKRVASGDKEAMKIVNQLNIKSFRMQSPAGSIGYNPGAKVSSKFGIGENLTNDDVYRMWKRGDISRKEHLMFTKFDPMKIQNINKIKTPRERIQEKIDKISNNPELSRNFTSNLQRNVDENIKKYGK